LTLHIATQFEVNPYVEFVVFLQLYIGFGFDCWFDFCEFVGLCIPLENNLKNFPSSK
jgi:hypothetical protein